MASLEELQDRHGGLDPMDAPIPGESLTQDPENKLPYEKPPTHVDMNEAVEDIFMRLTEEETLDEILGLMRNEVPVEDITQTLLFSGFREGKFNPDLMLNLIEPTMYMIMALGEVNGIVPTVATADEVDDDEDDVMSDDIAYMNVRDLLKRKQSATAEDTDVAVEALVPEGDVVEDEAAPAPEGVTPNMMERIQQMGNQEVPNG
jgi:hypothetical protein